MSEIKVKIVSCAHHRNGISGAPFEVVIFDNQEGDKSNRMVGILFDDLKDYTAVFDLARLAVGDIAFGSNSWRGDRFEKPLREALAEAEAASG